MITIVKRERKNPTYSLIGEEEFVRCIKGLTYEFNRLCSARCCAEFTKRSGTPRLCGYTGLVMLRVAGLAEEEEMERVMDDVAHIPYTRMAWRDKGEGAVVLVCRYDYRAEDEPHDETGKRECLTNAYKRLHYLYSCQLRLRLDTERPEAEMECHCVHDVGIYYCPDSLPIYVDARPLNLPSYRGEPNERPQYRLFKYRLLHSPFLYLKYNSL